MFKKFSRAWGIAKMCWSILKLDKELMMFTLLSLLTCGLLLVGIAGPLVMSGEFEEFVVMTAPMDGEGNINPLAIALDFAIYFVIYFVMIFFNTALVACARIRFSGGDPTVADGLKASINQTLTAETDFSNEKYSIIYWFFIKKLRWLFVSLLLL